MNQNAYRQPIRGFRILERLGSGAMGSVYRARQTALDRDVALKVVRRDVVSPSSLERFRKEARMLAQLNHPNIVRVFEMGEDGGYLYLAMELVEGRSLKDLLAERGRLPEATVLAIGEKVARGLAHASEQGIVHRDIKPGNILIGRHGVVKLSDFGLAMAGVERSLTRSGQTVGTPQYMAPEQTRHSRKVDVRSDLFSLGATLYHVLTGVPPFRGDSVAAVLTSLLFDVPERPEEIVPGVHRGTSRVLAKLLAKRPSRRYSKPDELVRDLMLVRASADGELDASAELGIDWRESGAVERPWYRRPEYGMLAAALLVGVILTFLFLLQGKPESRSETNAFDAAAAQLEAWYEALDSETQPLKLYHQVDAARLSGRITEKQAAPLLEGSLELALAESRTRLEALRDRVLQALEKGEPKRAEQLLEQGIASLENEDLPPRLRERITEHSSRLRALWAKTLDTFEQRLGIALSNRETALAPKDVQAKSPETILFPLSIPWGETIESRTGPDQLALLSWSQLPERLATPLQRRWTQKLELVRLEVDQAKIDLFEDLRAAVIRQTEEVAESWRERGPSDSKPSDVVDQKIAEVLELLTGSAEVDDLDPESVVALMDEGEGLLVSAANDHEEAQREKRRREVLAFILPLVEGRDHRTALDALENRTDLDESFKAVWRARLERLMNLQQQAVAVLESKIGHEVSLDHWTGVLESVARNGATFRLANVIEPLSVSDLSVDVLADLARESGRVSPLAVAEWLYFGDEIETAHAMLPEVSETDARSWIEERINTRFEERAQEARKAATEIAALWNKAQNALESGRSKVEIVPLYEEVLDHPWMRRQDLYDRLPDEWHVRSEAGKMLERLRVAMAEESERSQLNSLFRGAVRVDQDGRVTLGYVFESASEAKDFSLASHYRWTEGGLSGVRPSPRFDMYRASRGPQLDIDFDLDHDFTLTLVMTTRFEEGVPEFVGVRVMGLCFGVKTSEDVIEDAQANYWYDSLDAFEDHFTHHVLDKKRRSSHPIRLVPRLMGGGTYTLDIQYRSDAKEVHFLVDQVPYYHLTDVTEDDLGRITGIELRASVPVTFEELIVTGHLDSRWLREKRES